MHVPEPTQKTAGGTQNNSFDKNGEFLHTVSMAWTWEEIERDWLAGGASPDAPSTIVDAFNRVDAAFGRSWIEANHSTTGTAIQGSVPVLAIMGVVRSLAALEGIAGADKLIRKMEQRDYSAVSEATAIHILRSGNSASQVELEPTITGSERRPDFRIRRDATDGWTYVEVTKPETSVETQAVRATLQRLTHPLQTIQRSFALELFLRRPPTDSEIEPLNERVEQLALLDGYYTEELPNDLGRVFLNEHPPGQVVLDDHGESYRPRIAMARVVGSTGEGGEPNRHIAVRIAYTDNRAATFLRTETRQLPTDAPGLIMIATGEAVGALKRWEPVLAGRFRPNQYTRVSAIGLFETGILAEEPPRLRLEAKLVVNNFAKHPLPSWIADQVAKLSPADSSPE